MPIFGLSEPVAVAVIVLIIVLIIYVLPIIAKKKSLTDYSKYDIKNSNAFWHFAGVGGAAYNNIKLATEPVLHSDGLYTVPLEHLPNPLMGVNMDPMDKNCNVKVKLSSNLFFGERVDVLCNIDANSHVKPWDNVYVESWDKYIDRLQDSTKRQVLEDTLQTKELIEEIKGVQQPTLDTGQGIVDA